MTILAWDGKTLAADKQCTIVGYAHTVTKIHRVPDGIIGLCGSGPHSQAILAWFLRGRDPDKWPKKPEECDSTATAIFVTKDGVFGYACGYSEIYEDKFVAFGCGRDYAMAAMYLGKSAREAVEVACALDINCGKGIDTLELM